MKREFAEPIIHRPVDDSLILWFNGRGSRREGTVLADLSKKGNTGVITNAVWKNTPIGHSVLNFDGNGDYVEVAGYTIPITAFSISFWLYLNALPDSDLERTVNQAGATTKGFIFNFGSAAGANRNKPRFNICDDSAIVAQIIADNDLSAETWYYIVGTYESNSVKFYLNAIQQGSTDTSATMTTPTTTFTLGRRAGAASNYFNGRLNDIKVVNKVLTSNEIMKNFQKTKHLYGY